MRRVVLFLYALVMALMLVFPPTVVTTTAVGITKALEVQFPSRSESGGFRFIGQIGALSNKEGQLPRSLAMNFRQLGFQILVATLVAGACFLATRTKESS